MSSDIFEIKTKKEFPKDYIMEQVVRGFTHGNIDNDLFWCREGDKIVVEDSIQTLHRNRWGLNNESNGIFKLGTLIKCMKNFRAELDRLGGRGA